MVLLQGLQYYKVPAHIDAASYSAGKFMKPHPQWALLEDCKTRAYLDKNLSVTNIVTYTLLHTNELEDCCKVTAIQLVSLDISFRFTM